MKRGIGRLFILVLAGTTMMGCRTHTTAPVVVTPGGQLVAEAPPPAPRQEVMPAAPGTAYFWVPGYWAYVNSRWVWVPGRWEARPRAAAVWVPGYWTQTARGWEWTPGYWR